MMAKSVPEVVAAPSIQDDNVENVVLEQTIEVVEEGQGGLDNLILEGDA